MKKIIFKIYLKSPYIIKRLFANVEAFRRDYYRRLSDKNDQNNNENIIQKIMTYDPSELVDNFNNLLTHANKYVYYYRKKSVKNVNSLMEISSIDILTRKKVIQNKSLLIADNASIRKDLWPGKTSGSTGSPLTYFKDRVSMKSERESYDSYYEFLGCDLNENRVRISGVKVASFDREKPPYWLYIDKYKQLQCSTYHISKSSYKDYLREFEKRKVLFGTGFPSGWTALADVMLEENVKYKGLKAIITDSEGLSYENQLKIEKAFNCPVYKTYGLGEVGLCAIEGKCGNYHVLPSHHIEVINNEGKIQSDGLDGEIVVTDLNNYRYPFIRYTTGDLGIIHHSECQCGMKTPYLSKISGRIEDYILTKDGRKITRLSKIISPAIGIKESQIIQESLELITINVIPDDNFKEDSMKEVINSAKEFVGDMEVKWDKVTQLERMPSGKLKFLIRKI